MPYDPTPMGDDYFPSIQWEGGKPYQLTKSGKKSYVPPASAATADLNNPIGKRMADWAKGLGATYEDPGGATPRSGFAHNTGTWDQDTGEWDGGNFFNTSLGGLILGGSMMAAPYVAGAFAGGAGGAPVAAPAAASIQPATGATLAASSVLPTSTATALPSTVSSLGGGMNWGAILKGIEKGYDVYSGISDVAGGAAKSAQNQNNQRDQLALMLDSLGIRKREDAASLPDRRLSTSMRGSAAASAAPSKFEWGGPGSVAAGGQMPSFSGGPSGAIANLDPKTRELGSLNVEDMLLQEMEGGRSGGNTDMTQPETGQESGWDKVLGGTALTSAILAALTKKRREGINQGGPAARTTAPPVPTYDPYDPAEYS